jgi:hypothetical protein
VIWIGDGHPERRRSGGERSRGVRVEPLQQPHVIVGEMSSVDEGDGFTKTLASITLLVSGVAMEIATENGNFPRRERRVVGR